MLVLNRCLIAVAAILAASVLLLPKPSLSQTDWLKRGQELFGTAAKNPDAVTASQVAAGLKEA